MRDIDELTRGIVRLSVRERGKMVRHGSPDGSGLAALEFADCLLDSPEFRENLNRHEKELDKTSQQIKRIIKEIKDLLQAAKSEY